MKQSTMKLSTIKKTVLLLIVISLMLTACADLDQQSRVKISSEQDAGRATASLLAQADTQEQAQQWERAAAYLERALRIEPRNGYLWHRLARVRMQQGQYDLARSLVQKSEVLGGNDPDLKAKNDQLLDQLRLMTQEAPL
ncbi:tetratricopeptide repeat protein [Kaarinaea lacus]